MIDPFQSGRGNGATPDGQRGLWLRREERSIGLRIPIKHIIGDAPGNSKAQNKQVRDVATALGGLTPKQKNELHQEISGQGYDFQEILEIAKDMFKK